MSKVTENYADLASALGLSYDSANNVIYGQREGFDVVLYAEDSRYPYVLTFHTAVRTSTGVALSKDDFKELSKRAKALGVGKQEGSNVIVSMSGQANQEKLRNSVTEGMNELFAFFREKGCSPSCSLCSQAEDVTAYRAGSSIYHLCPNCETNMRGNLAAAAQQKEQKKENIVGGIVGALLGSLLGVVVIIILSRMGYVAALSGVIMAVGVLKGYELLGGKLTTKGIVISAVLMLVMTYVGDRLDWAIVLLGEGGGSKMGYNLFDCYRLFPQMLEYGFVEMSSYVGNLVLLYIFLLLGAVPTVWAKVKERKEEGKMVKIGAAASYNNVYTN